MHRFAARSLLAILALTLTAGTAHADRPALPAPRPQLLLTGPKGARGHAADARGHLNRAYKARQSFAQKARLAVERNDVGQMQDALRSRINMGQAKASAWQSQAKAYDALAAKYKGKNDKLYKKYTHKASTRRRGAARMTKVIAAYNQQLPTLATNRLAQYQQGAVGGKRTWSENKKLFGDLMKQRNLNDAADVLNSMKAQAGKGNRLTRTWRKVTLWRKGRALLKADKRLVKDQLNDQLHGRMSAKTVTGLLKRMEGEAKEGNWLQRKYKGFKLGLTKRRIRKTAEARMKESVRDGSIGWQNQQAEDGSIYRDVPEANLLALFGSGKAFRGEMRRMWKEERAAADQYAQSAEGGNLKPGSKEHKSFIKDARKGFFQSMRQELAGVQGSNFVEGLRVLNHLDGRSKRAYTKHKGVRRWVNKQVSRFGGWVLGSPGRSAARGKRDLLKHASKLLKSRDIDSHLQASALILSAKTLDVGDSRRGKRIVKKAAKRVQRVIKQAIKDGDPEAVSSAYDLYQAYGMDSKGREWSGPEGQAYEFKRDTVSAERNLIHKLTKQAEWIMLNPKKASMIGYAPVHAQMMNQLAGERASAVAAEMPGSVPRSAYKRMESNKRLWNGSFRGKLRKLGHSNLNPANWPWRIVKFVIKQPLYMLRQGPRYPKTPADPGRLQQLMERYAQPQGGGQAMAGGGQQGPTQEQVNAYLQEQMMMAQQQQANAQQAPAPAASAPPPAGQ